MSLVPVPAKKGFSLMEVLIASVVLSVGVAGIGHSIASFLQMKDRESKKGRALIEAVSLMEEEVVSPRPCVAPKDPVGAVSVERQGIKLSLTLESIPGGHPLQWAVIRDESGYWSDLTLKRIVKCVETASH